MAASSKLTPPAKPQSTSSPAIDKRVWYQKKRFAFPVLGAFFLLIVVGLAAGSDSDRLTSSVTDSSEVAPGNDSSNEAGDSSAKRPVAIGKSGDTGSGSTGSGSQPGSTSETAIQQEAREVAQSYYETSWFSRSGMIEQLEYEGFSYDDSVYGVDSLGADWFEEAIGMADSYIESSWFSRIGLIEQLEYEGFSASESQYGVDSLGIDWYDEALGMAFDYLDYSDFTYEELVDQLIYEGFSVDEAIYGVLETGYY
jgi:hypothetical protein